MKSSGHYGIPCSTTLTLASISLKQLTQLLASQPQQQGLIWQALKSVLAVKCCRLVVLGIHHHGYHADFLSQFVTALQGIRLNHAGAAHLTLNHFAKI